MVRLPAIALGVLLFGGCAEPPSREHSDLLTLVVDTLRADPLGLHGDPRPTAEALVAEPSPEQRARLRQIGYAE